MPQTVTLNFAAEFVLPDNSDEYYDTPEGVLEWYTETLRDNDECKRVYSRVDRRPLPDDDVRMLPVEVQAAINFLADWAVENERQYNANAEHHWRDAEQFDDEFYEKLRAHFCMAVDVQLTDPDYEQAESLILTEED